MLAGEEFPLPWDQDFRGVRRQFPLLGLDNQLVDSFQKFPSGKEQRRIQNQEQMAEISSPCISTQQVPAVVEAEAGSTKHTRENFHHQSQSVAFVPSDRNAKACCQIGKIA